MRTQDRETGRSLTFREVSDQGDGTGLSRFVEQEFRDFLTCGVLARIQSGDAEWETMVPPAVAETIKATRLFGVRS